MSAGVFCTREVDLADADESVRDAAARMRDRNVGTLLVLDEDKMPIGILTDRDLTLRVLAGGLDGYQTRVGDVMTSVPATISEDTSLDSALGVMRSGPYRRLPVVDAQGALVGLLSVDDVLDVLADEFRQIGELLQRESPRSLANP
ncbi:MAG: CBS domain-containing protein [Planctomycetales bacterium]|nr:CBS domain-containing protein [Planctomycetales bacterium]NIM07891.1 CBS domain-containing protein [Planctomycetales bacterium]NIN09031.1 CBS domain-containing protein [Planctomycetales bacterium]NIN78144.1 CBS domain-containing protein [Planctomycetales bacterium]NIO33672.1 CBS domain-containing protein [Planctomycetales bacterium]